jgi:hypothetical protein
LITREWMDRFANDGRPRERIAADGAHRQFLTRRRTPARKRWDAQREG